MSVPVATVFPDANILLHYKSLRDIDWLTLADAESVVLVLCPQVVHEVDKHKYDARLGRRADSAIAAIRAIHKAGGQVRQGVTLELTHIRARNEEIPTGLDPAHQDTQIIYAIKKYCLAKPDCKPVLVTGDFGMEALCAGASLPCLLLDDAYRLPLVADEDRKRLQQAQQELERLRNRLPILALSAEKPDDRRKELADSCDLLLEPASSPDDLESEMAEVMRQNAKLSADTLRGFLAAVTRTTPDEYNKEIENFYRDYRQYLLRRKEMEEKRSRTAYFDLWLWNGGTAPASGIEAMIVFPDILEAVVNTAKEHEPKPPSPPALPLERLSQELAFPSFNLPRDMQLGPSNISNPKITRGSGFRITIDVRQLDHSHGYRLGSFGARFASLDSVTDFGIDYSVFARELPDPSRGKLVLRVHKS